MSGPAVTDWLPGHVVVNRYEIERLVGAGGMGVVYRANDHAGGGWVALKVLRQHGAGSADRFAREIELLSAIEHPHIIGYITHGVTEEGAPFLVMPWIEGVDLQQRLRDGPLTIDETITVATCVASALACLHGQGLVHRDLKPGNIFLPANQVRATQLIDLGIARQIVTIEAMTMPGQVVGTPGYIAPEEARGDDAVQPAVDMFALGCVLYECLTARPLFTGSNVMAMLAKILLEDAPHVRDKRPDVPEALDAILHRMVAKDPSRRPRDGVELGRWLDDLSGAAPSSLHGVPPWAALTDSEQRVVSVLIATTSAPDAAPASRVDTTRPSPRFDAMSKASERFGVRVHALTDGTAIALAPDAMSAADKAAVLARFGCHLRASVPHVRVALATGMAVTDGPLPVGDAIEGAVRLVATTADGVHADDASAALLASRFDLRREGDAFVVGDERADLDATRPLLGRPTACVGRERELAILDATLRAVIDDRMPAAVVITAAPGAGKSRLRHELVRRQRGAGATWRLDAPDGAPEPLVLAVSVDPLATSVPYALAAQIARRAIDVAPSDSIERVQAKIAEHVAARVDARDAPETTEIIAELLGAPFDDDARPALRAARESPAAMTERVRAAFEAIALGWCRAQPVLVAIDDLHAADAESIKLLDRTIRAARGQPLFVLAFARPEVHERFPGLWALRNVTDLPLPPLGNRACTRIVRGALGASASNARVEGIVARSEGNAFFLEELIRASVEEERERGARAANAQPVSASPSVLPATVLAVAQARLERLDADGRRVLRAASIFGEEFTLDGLCALVGQPRSEVDVIVRRLIHREAIAVRDGADLERPRELRFRHGLLRSAAYASLTTSDRKLAHRLAAIWIEHEAHDPELAATHWLEAGERAEAAKRFTRAGAAHAARAQADLAARCHLRAIVVSDVERDDAALLAARVGHLADALEVTRGIDPAEATRGIEPHVAIELGGAARFVGAALASVLGALRKRASKGDLVEALARAVCAAAALGDFRSARTLIDEAERAAQGDAFGVVRRAAAKLAYLEGDFGRVADFLEPLVARGGESGAEALLMLAPAVVGVGGRDALPRGLEYVARAERALAASRESPLAALRCSKARLLCLDIAGERTRALEVAVSGAELARQAHLGFEQMVHLHMLAEICIRLGDTKRARAALAASIEVGADPDEPVHRGVDEPLAAYLDGLDGAAGAAARIEVAAERCRDASYPLGELHARYWLGRLLASTRDPRAVAELEGARALARRLRIGHYEDDCVAALAELRATRD